jgi:hypothetical protein
MRSKLPSPFAIIRFIGVMLLKPLLTLHVYFEEVALVAVNRNGECRAQLLLHFRTWTCALEKVTGFSSFFEDRL